MGLLWTFMGYSKPYTFFCGAVEVVGGLLLFWQRTTTLGALIVAAGMANVGMLNFSYDVPVKLYSSHLLMLAVLLLVPDLRRLARFFLLNQAAEPATPRPPFAAAWRNRTALAVKTVIIGIALWQTTSRFVRPGARPAPPKAARYGIYDVETFLVNGSPRNAVAMDSKRWRRVIVSERGGITVQTMDDAMVRYRTKEDTNKQQYELSTIFNPYETIVLTYKQSAPDRFVLEGAYGGDAVAVTLRRVPMPSFLLTDRGFHWISEYPYNR